MARTGRVTVKISTIVDEVNRRNRESTCDASMREGWNSALEFILGEAGAYAGYGYYGAKDVPAGEKPGVIYRDPGPSEYPDETRRFYHVKTAYSRAQS